MSLEIEDLNNHKENFKKGELIQTVSILKLQNICFHSKVSVINLNVIV